MSKRSRPIGLMLFFICISFCPLLWSAEIDMPLPADAVKTSDKSVNIGPTMATTQIYTTSLSRDRINSMYKKELLRQGWTQEREGLFAKDGYLAIIVARPGLDKKRNKTQFSITTTRLPTKEEILASAKENPDKLNFMPVYPGSKQNYLWDLPNGLSASYETKSSIKDVIFFYKSAMLGYGWKLSGETPITTKNIDSPELQKLAGQGEAGALKAKVDQASLSFSKSGAETCVLRLYQTQAELSASLTDKEEAAIKIPDSSMNKTTIIVTYNAHKKINP